MSIYFIKLCKNIINKIIKESVIMKNIKSVIVVLVMGMLFFNGCSTVDKGESKRQDIIIGVNGDGNPISQYSERGMGIFCS